VRNSPLKKGAEACKERGGTLRKTKGKMAAGELASGKEKEKVRFFERQGTPRTRKGKGMGWDRDWQSGGKKVK